MGESYIEPAPVHHGEPNPVESMMARFDKIAKTLILRGIYG